MAWEHSEDVYKSGIRAVLTDTQFAVELYLAHRIHPRQGFAWPSREEICRDLELSKGAVDAAIPALTKLGFLRTHRRGFDRLNFSLPSIEELSRALAAVKRWFGRAREEGIRQRREMQRWTLRAMEKELRPMLLKEEEIAPGRDLSVGEIAPGRDLSVEEIAPGRDLSAEEIAPGRDRDRARARSVHWTKEKEKEKEGQKENSFVSLQAKEKEQQPPPGDGPGDIWEMCKQELSLQLPETTYDTRFRNSRMVGHDEAELVVAVDSQADRAWIEHRAAAKVDRLVRQLARRAVAVRFVVEEAGSLAYAADTA